MSKHLDKTILKNLEMQKIFHLDGIDEMNSCLFINLVRSVAFQRPL